MGSLLKEALKILCGLNHWSYAVFWKFGCQNPKLLIWEECFYEPVSYSGVPGTSGFANLEPGFDNWDTHWASAEAGASQLTTPAGNKVHLLVNKMMMENHVNVVGEGLVGRAAFTGNHQWIISENYSGVAHPPEVLKEVYQQFSAGMQTVAVIPVLPYGVVQLGSCLAILENLGFVNDVKTLVQQLGCVPDVLLSDNYTTYEASPNIGLPVYPGKILSMGSSTRSDVINSTPIIGSCNNQVTSTQTAGFVGQTSCSLTGQVLDGLKSTAATFQASNMSRDLGKSHDELYQANILSLTKPNLPSMGQLLNGVTKAEVIPSHPRVWSNQQASMYSPSSTSEQQSSISSLSANNGYLRLLERRILTDAGFQNQTDNNLISGSHEIAVTIPSVELSELLKDVHSHVQTVPKIDSLQDASRSFNTDIPCVIPAGDGFLNASSSKTEESSSRMMDNLATNHLLPCGSVSGHQSDNFGVKTELNEKKEQMENDLFQGVSIPSSQHDEHMKSSKHIPVSSHGDEKLKYDAKSSRSLENSKYEDACMQHQSGDDLFDILGVDYRNKLLSGSWNSFLHNSSYSGSYSHAQNQKNKSTSLTSQDAASDLYSVNQGTSESGIFSVTGSDNLLDAVVSRVHPSIKQNLDDNISCKTTLTNTSNSSAVATSRSYGRSGVPDQIQGELFDFPKSLLRAGALGSCSFKSGSSKDNSGTYSQSSSIYGSQISSWVEQSHDIKQSSSIIKQSSSVSTAYSKKPDEMGKTNRKRLKPGENPRPRPKDRQMIQDRVKELREIVPNGAKCSIDALLERTIKHMHFLQSVTKHADKLKQTGESKILSKEGGLLLKDNYEGGVTWAYEVGSQSMVCPIIVEDLNQPRQMLVEMLCEERGLFLEIADIIRGLGLTILKGVMETRNDKIWARFVVEAKRDVTRMEIFISLVRLLEQTAKSGATPTNGVDNDAMMVHQFHQATSIPATGKPCGLQ